MNNNPQGQYPAGQYPQQSYQGAPADGYTAPAGAPGSSPAYYDATQSSAGGNHFRRELLTVRCLPASCVSSSNHQTTSIGKFWRIQGMKRISIGTV